MTFEFLDHPDITDYTKRFKLSSLQPTGLLIILIFVEDCHQSCRKHAKAGSQSSNVYLWLKWYQLRIESQIRHKVTMFRELYCRLDDSLFILCTQAQQQGAQVQGRTEERIYTCQDDQEVVQDKWTLVGPKERLLAQYTPLVEVNQAA